jgi:hypothetical protein
MSDVKRFFNSKVKSLKIRGLDVKSDGSIDTHDDNDFCPVELTLLVRQDDLSDLEKLCTLLNDLGATVNASCGLHVHLDSRDLSKEQVQTVGHRFSACLPFLADMVPKSRRSNQYCALSVSGLEGTRYHAVNLTAFSEHRTIEVRLHSSTTSFLKIKNWLKIISSIFEQNSVLYKFDGSISEFFKYIGADSDLQKYIVERTEKFNTPIVRTINVRDNEESDHNEPNTESEVA